MLSLKLEELRGYLLAEGVADVIWARVATWETFANDAVGKQLARAAGSVGANSAAGLGRGSFADNKRFGRIALGSFHEVRHFCCRADKRRSIDKSQKRTIQPSLKGLAPTHNAYLRSIGRGASEPDDQ